MRRKNPKFQQIVATGKELFWKYGIKKVSVEEICLEANVSKVTYYKHFSNKIDLLKFILTDLFEEGIENYHQIMDSDIPYSEKVELTIKMKMEGADKISTELLKELYGGTYPELFVFFQEYASKTLEAVKNDFIKAQKKGDIRQDINIDFLMYFLNNMLTMVQDENLTKLYDDPHDMIKEFTTFTFNAIVDHKKTN